MNQYPNQFQPMSAEELNRHQWLQQTAYGLGGPSPEPARATGIGEAVAKAMAALQKAEKQFTSYAEHHHAKGATEKAATNYGYAIVCGDALEHLKLYFGADYPR